ncbi:MAG: nucleotidyltransferase [Chloroflexi bacterium]|nr:nucleotidyltransferase [Chloroflexota bacterium]
MSQDVRWIQRFNHFNQAVTQLTKFIQKGKLNELEKQGLIQAFEYTYELAWNTMKDYLEAQGETNLLGSRDVIRLAFKRGLIVDGETWMDMLKSRTLTSHTYNEDLAEKIAAAITKHYFSEFVTLRTRMDLLRKDAQ